MLVVSRLLVTLPAGASDVVLKKRGRTDTEGKLVYFPGETNSLSLQLRFSSERNEALKALGKEQK
jgi:hypothetical protein